MADDYQKQFERFQKDVAEHVVSVVRVDGVYRHLRAAVPGTYCQSFDVITWPGHLCYTGDMGSYVFARLPDMFEFFRGRSGARVDRRYLAEKTVAGDKTDGIREYRDELFRAAVKRQFDDFAEDLDPDEKVACWSEIEDDVLVCADDGLAAAVNAAMSFRWKRQEVFPDFWDNEFEAFTGRFWWCCYAIPWAIERFDSMVAPQAPPTGPENAGEVTTAKPVPIAAEELQTL